MMRKEEKDGEEGWRILWPENIGERHLPPLNLAT